VLAVEQLAEAFEFVVVAEVDDDPAASASCPGSP